MYVLVKNHTEMGLSNKDDKYMILLDESHYENIFCLIQNLIEQNLRNFCDLASANLVRQAVPLRSCNTTLRLYRDGMNSK